MCNNTSPNSFLISCKSLSKIASPNSYVSSIVKWRKLSKVCFLSHGHFSLKSSIISKRRLNACNCSWRVFIGLFLFQVCISPCPLICSGSCFGKNKKSHVENAGFFYYYFITYSAVGVSSSATSFDKASTETNPLGCNKLYQFKIFLISEVYTLSSSNSGKTSLK